MVQRHVARLGLLIVEDGVALRKGAALAVLAGQAHRVAFVDQRAERQRFGHGPVDPDAGLDHLAAILDQPADGLVHVEPLRDRGEATCRFPSAGWGRRRCRPAPVILGGEQRGLQPRPAAVEPVGLVRLVGLPASNSVSRRCAQSACSFSSSPGARTPSPSSFSA